MAAHPEQPTIHIQDPHAHTDQAHGDNAAINAHYATLFTHVVHEYSRGEGVKPIDSVIPLIIPTIALIAIPDPLIATGASLIGEAARMAAFRAKSSLSQKREAADNHNRHGGHNQQAKEGKSRSTARLLAETNRKNPGFLGKLQDYATWASREITNKIILDRGQVKETLQYVGYSEFSELGTEGKRKLLVFSTHIAALAEAVHKLLPEEASYWNEERKTRLENMEKLKDVGNHVYTELTNGKSDHEREEFEKQIKEEINSEDLWWYIQGMLGHATGSALRVGVLSLFWQQIGSKIAASAGSHLEQTFPGVANHVAEWRSMIKGQFSGVAELLDVIRAHLMK